jgi:hypothetical protein
MREGAAPGELERVIVNQCGPVLLGCKPAALFPLRSRNAFARLCGLLGGSLRLTILKETAGPLVLAFEEKRLRDALGKGEAQNFLAGRGYPRGAPPAVLLDYLRGQFAGDTFPHEIGLFLGYPPEDVCGFVRHRGRNYKLCGYWKVYGDVEQARRCFRRYDACRDYFRAAWALRNNLSSGRALSAIPLPSPYGSTDLFNY